MTTPHMSCPTGGTFYACASGSNFVGCCLNDPCTNGCAAGSLVSTSFDASQYGSIPDQSCGTGNSGDFFTCIYTGNTTFWGCCSTNPCKAGSCPSNNLMPAMLNSNQQLAAPFLGLNSSYAATASSSVSTASATSSTSVSSTNSAAASNTVAPQSSVNGGAIAGGVVGGIAVLAAFIIGLLYLLRRNRRAKASQGQQGAEASATLPEMATSPPQDGFYAASKSPAFSTWSAQSPQPPYSPPPPGYIAHPHYGADAVATPVPHELPAGQEVQELAPDSHTAKAASGLGVSTSH